MAVSGNWWNDHAPASPPAVCAEKTLERFRTGEVTDVMPTVFTHLQHGGMEGEMCAGIQFFGKYLKR